MGLINQDGSLNAPSKVGLVNMCLNAIGESNIEDDFDLSLAITGTDVQNANNLVDEVTLEVMNIGWWFNTEDDFEFIPDSNGFIAIPQNMLKVDFGNSLNRGKIIKKEGKLYNQETKSYIFEENVKGKVVFLSKWEFIPYSAYNYIGLRAARKFQQRIIGSNDMYRFTMKDEDDAYISLQREQAQLKDYNMIENRVLNRYSNTNWTMLK